MTSKIEYTSIDKDYPVAGQDNNSQGFRDNFNIIKGGLATASSEITELQSKAILAQTIDGNDVVVNDLLGSTISNGLYTQFSGVIQQTSGVSGSADIDLENGPLQIFTVSANSTLRFNNWPTGAYSKVRVHLRSTGSSTPAVTLSTSGGGSFWYISGSPNLTLSASITRHKILEAWSYDGGQNVFVQYIGEFTKA